MTRKCLTHTHHSCHISSFCLLRVRLYVEQFIVQSCNFIAPLSPLPQCVMSECHSVYLQNILNPLYRNGGKCMDGFESDFTCVYLFEPCYCQRCTWSIPPSTGHHIRRALSYVIRTPSIFTRFVFHINCPAKLHFNYSCCVYNCNISSTPNVHFTDLKRGALNMTTNIIK
jgi:hypothetical protein